MARSFYVMFQPALTNTSPVVSSVWWASWSVLCRWPRAVRPAIAACFATARLFVVSADPYGDPDLVAIYDVDNPAGMDHEYYRTVADTLEARRIVDLGCGTGLLTRTLVKPGRVVTGIDPSITMLNWARAQPGAEHVSWVQGDATAIAPTGNIDLVVCTGNAIMHLDQDELGTALSHIRKALRPGGTMSFESRNPVLREWERWTREATRDERETALGRLTQWIDVTDVTDERVTFEAHNVLPSGEHRVYTNILYFRDVDAFQTALRGAGFQEVEVFGGWRGEEVSQRAGVHVYQSR